jgi:5-methylcytosine-specific restriction protein A
MTAPIPLIMGTPQTMPSKPWHHSTESNTERGYGSRWRKLRASVMMRDKGLCQLCLASHRVTPANECDHIIPKHKGGTDDPANLQMLCSPCHADKTQKEAATAQGRRLKVQIGLDGWPVE